MMRNWAYSNFLIAYTVTIRFYFCHNDRKGEDVYALSFATINKFVINSLLHIQVDGDGCVFVWKLPTPLSSKILERIMVKSNPLPSRSSGQHPPCLSFCKEECQYFMINPKEACSLRNNSQSWDGVLHPKSSHREASSFKFSVSRLPKWAQAKVTSCSRNLNYTSSEVSVLWIISFPFWKTPLY